MVAVFSCANAAFLLLATALVAGYQRSPIEGDASVFEYRRGGGDDDDATNLNGKRDSGRNVMWIGPRLGRRKRSEGDGTNLSLPDKNGAVLEILHDVPWAFVAVKGSKRRTVNFIPRLGRDSEEEYVANGAADEGYDKSGSRSGNEPLVGPFAGGNNFTPRLGRFAAFYSGKDHV